MYLLQFLLFFLFSNNIVFCQDEMFSDGAQELYDSKCYDEQCSTDLINCTIDGCVCRNFTVGYFYNATTNTCDFNLKLLLLTLVEKHHTQEQLKNESMKVFRGILVSAILFATCAGIGLVSACIYCCRISYKDEKLKRHIKNKFPKTEEITKSPKPTLSPISESCNVVVEEAGLFVV